MPEDASAKDEHIDTSEVHDQKLREELDAYFDAYIAYDKTLLMGPSPDDDWKIYSERVSGLRDLASLLAQKLSDLAYIKKLYAQANGEFSLVYRASAYALYCAPSNWS